MIYIGIDFGHGETTVSRVPGYNGSPVSQIALTNTNNAADKKIKSAVCKKNDKWSLVYNPDDYRSADLREGFKAMVKGPSDCRYRVMSPKDRESMREFAKLVFATILRYDGELKYNSFEDRNFVLGIACPSGWVNEYPDAQREYLDFFRNECGLPVDICIKESDAAFFTKFYNQQYDVNDRVFVIDLGSSTIDFTTYSGGKCNSKLCWGECLGAHQIDDLLVNAIINAEDNAANIAQVNTLRQQLGLGNCDSALSLYTRDFKENIYSRNEDDIQEDSDFSVCVPYDKLTSNWTGNFWDVCVGYSVTYVEFQNIVRSYMDRMRDTLQHAKTKLEQNGITPNKVLLSGGACNMPFVQAFAREIFADADVYKDPQPECVVSNGVALYAKMYTEAWDRICVAINAFDFENSYKEADRAATFRATKELFPAVLDTIEGTRDMTCYEMHKEIAMFFLGLTPENKEYSEMLNTSINTSINAWARNNIKTILENAFHVSIKETDINIVVKTEVMCYPVAFFTEVDKYGFRKIYNLMEEATGPHIFTNFDFEEKERDFSDRYDIARKCEEQLCVGDPFGIGYNPEHLNMICTDIKDQCIAEARKIFETKQLFESTFKQ